MPKKNKSVFNLTKTDYLKAIARETAQMSYPGSMSRQRKGKQIVVKGTKKAVEEYFANEFQIEDLWDKKKRQKNYDQWHKCQVKKLSEKVVQKKKGNRENKDDAISAKFLDTFMHQLMKYGQFRWLYEDLHLPLDQRVFERLAKLQVVEGDESLKNLKETAKNYMGRPYQIDYPNYKKIQKQLSGLKSYFSKTLQNGGAKLESRVELNCILWAT